MHLLNTGNNSWPIFGVCYNWILHYAAWDILNFRSFMFPEVTSVLTYVSYTHLSMHKLRGRIKASFSLPNKKQHVAPETTPVGQQFWELQHSGFQSICYFLNTIFFFFLNTGFVKIFLELKFHCDRIRNYQ